MPHTDGRAAIQMATIKEHKRFMVNRDDWQRALTRVRGLAVIPPWRSLRLFGRGRGLFIYLVHSLWPERNILPDEADSGRRIRVLLSFVSSSQGYFGLYRHKRRGIVFKYIRQSDTRPQVPHCCLLMTCWWPPVLTKQQRDGYNDHIQI